MRSNPANITHLLVEWQRGDKTALERLMPAIYNELRRIARRQMRGQRPGHTLQTTDLVNEACLRLAGGADPAIRNRAHFFGTAATAMRHILVDYARARKTGKRGGAWTPITLNEATISTERGTELIALDDALNALTALHTRQAKVVEMRYFGGLSLDETAEALQVSQDTVLRDWKAARAWLHRELRRGVTAPKSD